MESKKIKGYSLSPQQKRLWMLDPHLQQYAVECALFIDGPFNQDLFVAALLQILNRHEILRTRLYQYPGQPFPLQVIEEVPALSLEAVELSGLDEAGAQERMATWLEQEREVKGYEQAGGELRVCLGRLSERQHMVGMSLAAIYGDLRTLRNVVQEMVSGYGRSEEECEGRGVVMQYADYAEWQNVLGEGEGGEERAYWQQQQQGEEKCEMRLGGEGEGGEEGAEGIGVVRVGYGVEEKGRLELMAEGAGVREEEVVEASWGVMVKKVSGEEEVWIGKQVEGRRYEALRGAMGAYSKNLPVSYRFDDDYRFSEILEMSRNTARTVCARQDYYTQELIFSSSDSRSRRIGYEYEEWPAVEQVNDTRFTTVHLYSWTEEFKLKLSCMNYGGQLELKVYYDKGVYSARKVERLVEGYEGLLRSVVENPESRISGLNVVGAREQQQLLVEWNQTQARYPSQCIHEMFEQQVERTPEAVAVVYEQQTLSYGELNRRANQLAHHLRGVGVGAETVVGLCVERSLEMIVGLLGVVKAGAAYLPLDPTYPQQRLEWMMADSGAGVVLTQEGLVGKLGAHTSRVICLDSEWGVIAQQAGENPANATCPDNAAYVIYTSGSTGKPKGVIISEQALANHMHWMLHRFGFCGEDRLLQKTPFSFDASVWEFYAPLVAGGELILAAVHGHQDCAYLLRTIVQHRVTTLQVVPTLLRALIKEEGWEQCDSIRQVMVGGEALGGELTRGLAERSRAEVYNLYGPTEAAIDSTYRKCEREERDEVVGIGVPISNAKAYILDGEGQLAGIGARGELHISGAGLGRGYVNRPDLTAERFLPHPYSEEAGARMYRTGDVARYKAGGEIEYIGRVDEQVKVRGYRIELGEIEAVLAQHPAVSECAVVVKGDEKGSQQIVAYVVGRERHEVCDEEVRSYLKERLPEYMQPGAIVGLEKLPVSASGKIDRRGLRELEQKREEARKVESGSKRASEEMLAGIWEEVLGIEGVGIEDNFYEMGGHSLLATQVTLRAREVFKVELPLRNLFETPTIRGLSASIEQLLRAGQRIETPSIQPFSRDRDLPLSFAQQRLWFLNQLEPNNPFYNGLAALHLSGSFDVAAMERTLNEIIRRHEVLRTSFKMIKGQPVQIISPTEDLRFDIEDLSTIPESERESKAVQLASEESRQPFNLSTGPVLRVKLLRLSAEEHVLLVTMHHIVSDGWSVGVFMREVKALYEAFANHLPSPLGELPIQYADFALWQRQWLQGEILEQQLEYWRARLGGDLPVLELPTDRPRPAVQSFQGASQSLRFSSRLSQQLKQLSRDEGVTLFMTLLAGFEVLLYRYSGQEDVVVGTPIANRNRVEIEKLIGFFVNTLVLRADLSGNPRFVEMMGRVREVALGAYAHQDVPFEKLVEELQPERSLSQQPLFQAVMVLQNAPVEAMELRGLRLSNVGGKSRTAKFDLLLALAEGGGEISGALEYSTDLFDEATIKRMATHLRVLLEAIVSNPQQRIDELALLSAAEQQQLLVEWNQTQARYPSQCIHEMFEQQVERTPEAVAVVYEQQTLSYGELNRRANQLAHHLRGVGVGVETVVGLCVERSLEMVVGLLGVVKAGAAYLPLDPTYPQQRLEWMMADSGAGVVLTQEGLVGKLAAHTSRVICLDSEWGVIAQQAGENPANATCPDNAAYVIYTSGSTGKPKGVLVTHHNVARLMLTTHDLFNFDQQDVWTMFHSYAFDFSVWEIWGALIYGGKLIIVPYWVSRTPQAFLRLLRDEAVTVLNQTPSAFRQLQGLLQEAASTGGGSLRAVIFGGEALDISSLASWYEECGKRARLVNMYGITETTVHVTYSEVEPSVERERGGSRIGRAIEDLQIYLLDQARELVGVGMSGEIYVGGEGLARGYLGRPELTAERFLPHPYSQNGGGQRVYRTGDLARHEKDGALDYLGRVDQQVKVRGYRIELGEIEAVLRQHPAVSECAVVVKQDEVGEPRLVGYLVADRRYQASGRKAEAWKEEHLSQWEMLYNGIYSQTASGVNPYFNITGWNSSYTGEAIEAEQMQEWVEQTVERILRRKPKRILEIGAGTGLLLFRLARQVEQYYATDMSGVAIEYLREHVEAKREELGEVKLMQREAEEMEGLPRRWFDVVILNSVVQYFPNVEYLKRVIGGAVGLVRPGGYIFIGDVRNLEWMEEFHTTVQMRKASEGMSVEQMKERIAAGMREEEELLIEAGLFREMVARGAGISRVRMEVKRGVSDNEMQQYRYDVEMEVGGKKRGEEEVERKQWELEGLTVERLREELRSEKWKEVRVEDVPNRRVIEGVVAVEELRRGEARTVGELRRAVEERSRGVGVEPEEIWEMGEAEGYDVEVGVSEAGGGYRCEVVMRRKGGGGAEEEEEGDEQEGEEGEQAGEWARGEGGEEEEQRYGNDPQREKLEREIEVEVRVYVQERLPEYMVPGKYVVMGKLPRTGSGKVDRRELAGEEEEKRGGKREGYEEAGTPVEEMLVGIWEEVLGAEGVGIHDNVFDLGGHSLLATRLVSRVRDLFSINLPLRSIFELQTIHALSASIDQLLKAGPGIQAPPIVRADRSAALPLSFAQQRLWFLDQLAPGNSFYNISVAVRLEGRLDLAAMAQTLSEITRRHEVLRTTFMVIDGEPMQVIGEVQEMQLEVEDLRGVRAEERAGQAERIAVEEAQKGFDLRADGLMRGRVIKLAEEEHILIVTMHHIVSDGWSMGVLMREVGALYAAYSHSKQSPLEELGLQYADFAVWQREWLKGEVLEQQLEYWRERLGGELPVLEMPADRVRPAIQSHRGEYQTFGLSKEITEGLKALSRDEGVTLFMTLLAGFEVLLYRYSGQEDVVVGTPIANRNRVEIEKLIGFFVNTLVLRADLSGNPRFVEMMGRVREVALGAYAHQDVPFEKLVEELQPERSLSQQPLFQAVMVLQNAPVEAMELRGLRLSNVGGKSRTAKFDLLLALAEGGGEISGALEYSTDLFDEATIKRMATHLRVLLEAIVSNPQQRIDELALLSAAEQQQLLVEWNQTQARYPSQCIHEMFEQQVERTPEAVAVVYEQQTLSYGELNRRANQLAHHLRGVGVGVETVVGLCVERSLEMIVGLLGVVKAGAAYLPLDPTYPQQRLEWMLEDTGVQVVLTQEGLMAMLPESTGQRVCLDADWHKINKESTANVNSGTTADNAAYVIYTSGSTGQPKGISIPHRAVSRLVLNTNYIHFSTSDRVAQISNTAFDAATFEIWGALLNGGQLIGIDRDVILSPAKFAEHLQAEGITSLLLITALFNHLVDHAPTALKTVRDVLFGGEAAEPKWAREVLSKGPPERLLNVYGPAENTTLSLWHPIDSVPEWTRTVPIGKPVSNTQAFLVDRNVNPLPVGIMGELCLGGDGLARGYLRRPELTAEKFIPDPFSGRPGTRLYKTGDLARYLADGSMEFLGRADSQVKVRGFRVEPGEIETVLSQHAAVSECIVIAKQHEADSKRLIAYVSCRKQAEITEIQLRDYLRERLPDYMVPAFFVLLQEMPLTLNGKIDRRALPEPDLDKLIPAQALTGARTPIEELLASIWANVLGIQQVGIFDNFYDLGGHSLLATRLVSRVRDLFSINLPLRSIFELQTIHALSASIDQLLKAGPGIQAPPIVRADRSAALPLSFAQQRLWFLDQLAPGNSFYNISVAVRLEGRLDLAAMAQTLSEITRRHEVLRTTFMVIDGEPMQVIGEVQEMQLEVEDLRGVRAEERAGQAERIAVEEAQKGFDLRADGLMRGRVIKLAEEEHILIVTMHHIVSDGWSMGVLMREVGALYAAYSHSKQSPLEELGLQYADFAVWQREWLKGEVLEQQLEYWRERLGGELPVLEMPADRVRPAIQSHRGEYQTFGLSKEITEGLKALSRDEGVTLFMTLLAGFEVLLYRYSGQEDVVVGTPIANRNRVEIEKLIGFFVNTLVLRADLSGNPRFVEMMGRVREVALGAYAHQDVPFEKLVEELQPRRDLSRSPLFQVMFAWQNAGAAELEIQGLSLSSVGSKSQTAIFDLTLSMSESKEGFMGYIEYTTDLFDSSTIKRMIEHLQVLLEGVTANPQQLISSLPLLSESERHQLITEWNNTSTDFIRDLCLHQLFEAQVKKSPDALAVIFEQEQLSYRELNCRANQLAHYLISVGVGPDSLVGVFMERSVEMVLSLVATLKAGGAYVPLDPTYPKRRLAFMLEDLEVTAILTQQRLADSVGQYAGIRICVDQIEDKLRGESQLDPPCLTKPDNLAYVIYTSGSTGQPKGVMNTHRGICNRLLWMQEAYELSEYDKVLQKTPYSFDVSVWEFYWPLITGAQLVVARPGGHQDSGYLVKVIREQEITTIHFVPSMLQVMLQEPGMGKCSTLKRVISSGEELTIGLQEAFFECVEGDLNNLYGPTEASVDVTWWACERRGSKQKVPIGRPIANTQIYILDREQEQVPIGIRGELYIGGVGLARGYMGGSELTAERFIPDRHSEEQGGRIYGTGDIGRYLEDGTIEYIGRDDQQVKVRGYRIELGEIEAVLAQHPAVNECAVIAKPDRSGLNPLVAFVVPSPRFAFNLFDRKLYLLPNNLKIAHLNKNETDFLYKEIFIDENYLKHGISLSNVESVFDVGANIGLFSLFIHKRCPQAQIYAFEPIPPTFDVLQTNAKLHAMKIRLFDCGLSNAEGKLKFTYYPRMSAMSGAYADAAEDEKVARVTLRNQEEGLREYADELMAGRFDSQSYEREVRTISEIIKQEGVKQIDLLKIDAEKSELDVLRGIEEGDWEKIRQIVIEVHEEGGQLEEVTRLLKRHGYKYVIEQEAVLEETGIYSIYAIDRRRREEEEERGTERKEIEIEVEEGGGGVEVKKSELREYLRERLPDYMVPGAIVMLERLPVRGSGKLDRRALAEMKEGEREEREEEYKGASTETEEKLVRIWGEVLGIERISVYDNFFDLGGHSLLATQVVSRVREVIQIDLPLRSLFESPTIASLGLAITHHQQQKQSVLSPINKVNHSGDEDLLSDLNLLSEEEINSMLVSMSSESGVEK